MTSLQKILLAIAIMLSLAALLIPSGTKQTSLGGLVHTLSEDFTAGLRVRGTEVISSARAITGAAITGSSLTITGTSLLGSATAGAYSYAPVVAPAADATLTVSQTNAIVKMNTAGEDITLPAVASSNGVRYRFVVTAAVATTNMTINSAEGDNIEGTLIVAGAVVDCDANDLITYVIDGENIGDFVDLYSDGTSWLIGASGTLTASKMTCSG